MSDVSAVVAEIGADQALLCDLIAIAKGNHSLSEVFAVFQDVVAAAAAAPGVLPELPGLDAEGAAELGSACYSLVKAVMAALKA